MSSKTKSYFEKLKGKSNKEKDYVKITDRLMYILAKLDSRQVVSTRQLAQELGVTPRTIQRDIEILNKAGFPIYSPKRGLHAFMEGFSLKRVELNEEQAAFLSFMYEISRSLGKRFENSFKSLLKRVIAKEVDSVFYAKIPQGITLDESLPFLKEIESAINENKKLNVCYLTQEGKEKSFKLDPLKIAFYDGFWYLVVRVDKKDWILKLRLERIKKIEVLDEYFTPPENLKMLLDESVNIWFSEKKDKKIILKIDKDVVHFFKEKKYFPLQKIKKINKDGSLIIECKASSYDEVVNTIKYWIPYIKVIKPKELKEELKGTIKEYLREI
ncbi:MAG: WYL domain-containing protein [Candidatus Omnitrophica bacterium]|nr:WYL domain-containing protein [Candidatus Omnitrophota bacterium]MCM8826894.1 WYL domain-containing protein [Candidatus Omnitrophota bacterium]